jgi:predicted amidohydrolase YtcJ
MRLKPLQSTLIALAAGGVVAAHADTVIDNANGYTLNARGDIVQFASLAFDDDGKIIAVGAAKDVAGRAPNARHVDLRAAPCCPA